MNTRSCSKISRLLYAIFLLAFCLGSPALHAQSWESWQKAISSGDEKAGINGVKSRSSAFYVKALKYYQKNISPRQGKNCPAMPSCSSFTLSAMSEYGFIRGFFMGLDRIYFRENPDMKNLRHYLQVTLPDNLTKVYDPVEANNIFSQKEWTIIDPDFSYRVQSR
ncbi:MAG: membrane protein insertion efficiency factor YidD [Bacteroidales bacterium]|jgi:putative component of membrane protein insertase Oxa1/YidC/SpoIIIJ protein YidD